MKIRLAVEDFRCAEIVRKSVITQFKTDKTELRLVHALEPFPVGLVEEMGGGDFPDFVAARERRRERLQKAFSEASDAFRSAGFPVTSVVREGDARDVILDCAKEWRADLIVVCSDSQKGLTRFLLGSVAEAAARHAHCSVEIIRIPSGQ
jgi:nucleotide-binding universal stress UspA family protein